MIVVYKTLTEVEIRRDARGALRKINKFFKQNPERSECVVGVWYGENARIHRDSVKKDLAAAVDAALKKK